MEYTLKNAHFTAVAESRGGELVSLRDMQGKEYIWAGTAPYWAGRNPVLFPIVGRAKDDTLLFDGKAYAMSKHGFARKSDFAVAAQGDDYITFCLTENENTLAQYPFPFRLCITHRLTDKGFATEYAIENTGDTVLPCCIGGHTAYRCPAEEGAQFSDYEIVFDEAETAETMLINLTTAQITARTEPWLNGCDRFDLDYGVYARLDTLVFDGLNSHGVALRHKATGHGVHVDFAGFPMLGIWTQGAEKAPFICLEPWHGCSGIEGESGEFTHKRHALLLAPGEVKKLTYTVTTF